MIIRVKVCLGIKHESVSILKDGRYLVSTSADRRHGEANAAVIRLLSEFMHIPQGNIKLTSGHTQSSKMFQVKEYTDVQKN